MLYVADTGNDQIRVVDFQVRAVHTIDVSNLKSPWDLALKTGILIVAMAGPHQLWVVDLLHDQAYPYAGSGEEARRDGVVTEAAFAQPSGLAIDGNTLYVADAESGGVDTTRKAWRRGIRIGSARDGSITAFIPDPDTHLTNTSSAEGVGVDKNGVIYGAEVGQRALKRYVRKP